MSQLAEADRQRTRLEEENRASEARLMSMRQDMDELVRYPIYNPTCAN